MQEFYEKNGYWVEEGFFTEQECEQLIEYTRKNLVDNRKDFISQKLKGIQVLENGMGKDSEFVNSGDKIHYFFEKHCLLNRDELIQQSNQDENFTYMTLLKKVGHALHDLDPFYEKICYSKRVEKILRELNYQNPTIVQSLFLMKNARIGGQVNPHRDNTFLRSNPQTCLAFWVALEDATVENGCLGYIPGSHRSPCQYFMRRTEDNTDTYFEGTKDEVDKSQALYLPVKRGTLVLMHGDLIHLSSENLSDKSRFSFAFHVVEHDEKHTWDPKNWLQRTQFDFKQFYSHPLLQN